MKGKVYVPYAYGDCVRGFVADKVLSTKEYTRKILDDYYSHRDGIDTMMETRLGFNIAINSYEKHKDNVKRQNYKFNECNCFMFDIENHPETLAHLDEMYRNRQKFVLILNLNANTVKTNDDLREDIVMWMKDTNKVYNCPQLTDEEAIMHLPKKDLKIKIEDDGSVAVLKDCKILDVMGQINNFALLVDRIVFVNE